MHIKALYKLKSLRECNRLLLKSESISTYRVFSTLSLEYLVHSFVTGIVISRDYILLWNIDFIAYANRGASFEVNKNKQKDVIDLANKIGLWALKTTRSPQLGSPHARGLLVSRRGLKQLARENVDGKPVTGALAWTVPCALSSLGEQPPSLYVKPPLPGRGSGVQIHSRGPSDKRCWCDVSLSCPAGTGHPGHV